MVAPARKTLTEDDLFAGYGAELRTEPCACGGIITAPRNDWTLIGAALRLHYLTDIHQWYRNVREAAE